MLTVTRRAYRLHLDTQRPHAILEDAAGRHRADLALAATADTLGALDVVTGVREPRVTGDEIAIDLLGGPWQRKRLLLECADDALWVRLAVEGDASLTDVTLLGGHAAGVWRDTARMRTRVAGASLVSPAPSTPDGPARPIASATLEASGASLPGRGHWFFTPPPFVFAVGADPVRDTAAPPGPWTSLALAAPPGEHTFTSLTLDVIEDGLTFVLRYEGETRVRGAFTSPAAVIGLDASDPYDAIARHTTRLRARRLAPIPPAGDAPEWWTRPIFCGWGAQCAEAPRDPAALATAERYDAWLAHLAREGVHPGTIVVDDKWQRRYGTCEADTRKWPDLRSWIAARHERGQRVLLWWKAWDPEGLAPEECVRTQDGRPVAADPTHPGYERTLRGSVRRMLGAEGYDADGLKIDFTGQTPSAPGLRRHGELWGIELLHRLLSVVYDEAKRTKADALIVTHTPNPYFADVTDMIRLNDAMRLYDHPAGAPLVAHMVHRAAIVRAALPEHPIDTDNWAMPDRATWRSYVQRQPELGVPCLYYATGIDRSGERFSEEDYALVRRVFGRGTPSETGRRPSAGRAPVSTSAHATSEGAALE